MATMTLEFQQAMSDFKTMFPEMDREVIEAVLRANAGAVDATIDQLLAMSTDNQNEKLRNELDDSGTNDSTDTPTLVDVPKKEDEPTEEVKTTAVEEPIVNSSVAPTPSCVAFDPFSSNTGASPKIRKTNTVTDTTATSSIAQAKWNPPMLSPLPATFLRITTIGANDFDLPDEQFAMMLQNEEFMNELRWNQEFMTALEKDNQGKQDDLPFKERVRHMGKISRKKFLQVARVFTWQRNKKVNAKQIDSLPLKEEHSDDEEPGASKK